RRQDQDRRDPSDEDHAKSQHPRDGQPRPLRHPRRTDSTLSFGPHLAPRVGSSGSSELSWAGRDGETHISLGSRASAPEGAAISRLARLAPQMVDEASRCYRASVTKRRTSAITETKRRRRRSTIVAG